MSAPLAITVSLIDLHGHYFDVRLDIDRSDETGDIDLQMAAWTPGSSSALEASTLTTRAWG